MREVSLSTRLNPQVVFILLVNYYYFLNTHYYYIYRIETILGFFSLHRLSDNINQFQARVDDGLDDLSNYLNGGTKVRALEL